MKLSKSWHKKIWFQIKIWKLASLGLLHLKFIHPLWKILGKCVTGGEWIFKCTYLVCEFLIRFITEGVNVLFRSAKWAYLLGIHTPPWEMFLKSSTGGVWNLNGVTQLKTKTKTKTKTSQEVQEFFSWKILPSTCNFSLTINPTKKKKKSSFSDSL